MRRHRSQQGGVVGRVLLALLLALAAALIVWHAMRQTAKPAPVFPQPLTIQPPAPRTPVAPSASTPLPAPTAAASAAPTSDRSEPQTAAQRSQVTLEPDLLPEALNSPAIQQAIADLTDINRPLEDRLSEIAALGKQGDETAMLTLMALGNMPTYANWAAIEALGAIRRPEVAAYVKSKLSDPDARIVTSAAQSYGQLLGEAAVPDLIAVIQANQMRLDGFEQGIRTQAVETLSGIGSDQATAPLVAELDHASDPAWDVDYGSTVVQALRHIGDPAAAAGLERYAGQLIARLPDDSPKSAPARRYLEQKIEEVRTTIVVLQADAVGLERLAPAAVDPTVAFDQES